MDNLKTSFGKQKVSQDQKTEMVQTVFSEVSKKYDLMNDLMSFGTHRLWKKNLIEIMNIQNNDNIIDVGSGTGDLIKIIQRKNPDVSITSIDLNIEMLKYGKNNFTNSKRKNINWINCNAEKLPFKNDFFDKYIISFCLRNITLIDKALTEAMRILKPGGTFFCLEFSTPQSPLVNKIYQFYKKNIIPLIGEKIANNKRAYRYLEQSISQFPHQDVLLTNLKKLGYINPSYTNLFDGIVCIHKATKI